MRIRTCVYMTLPHESARVSTVPTPDYAQRRYYTASCAICLHSLYHKLQNQAPSNQRRKNFPMTPKPQCQCHPLQFPLLSNLDTLFSPFEMWRSSGAERSASPLPNPRAFSYLITPWSAEVQFFATNPPKSQIWGTFLHFTLHAHQGLKLALIASACLAKVGRQAPLSFLLSLVLVLLVS